MRECKSAAAVAAVAGLFLHKSAPPIRGARWYVVHGSTRRGALWAAPALLFWQPEVRVAAHHVAAALHVLSVVG